MPNLIKTKLAEEDLIGIWVYTFQEWGEQQADLYLDDLNDALLRIEKFPEIARERKELSPSVRIQPHKHHLVVYTFDESNITIIRVLHESMNIDDHLRDED